MDRFKRINDKLGHPAGDAVLRQGIKFVASTLRKYHSVYRYGGEEFLICLPAPPEGGDPGGGAHPRGPESPTHPPAQRRPLQRHRLLRLGKDVARRPVEETIANADMALMRAKENGRNRVELWQGH